MSAERFQDLVDDTFHQIESRLNGAAAGPLHAVRRKALEAFQRQGVPTTRHEEWKYTNILPSLGPDYRVQPITSILGAGNSDVRSHVALNDVHTHISLDAYRLQLINGRMNVSASVLPDDGSIEVQDLTDAYVNERPETEALLNALAPVNTHAFVAANAAMMDAGVVIRIRAGTALARPLHISAVSDASDGDVVSTPHILVVVEASATCMLIEEHVSAGDNASLTSSVTQIVAERDSKPTYVKIVGQGLNSTKVLDRSGSVTHIGHTSAIVHANAALTCVTFCLGGHLTRNELEIRLVESGAETHLYGLSVLSDNELADNHTLVDHVAPHCHSEEEYKGVYDGRSTGVFNGKIMVRPDAQKTTAYQSTRAVLLSPSAQINAKPQLEIFADDVKCSHGATCGQIDEDAVFYLQSRGIGHDDARALIVYAFAADIVKHVPHDVLRALVDRRIADKLDARPFDL